MGYGTWDVGHGTLGQPGHCGHGRAFPTSLLPLSHSQEGHSSGPGSPQQLCCSKGKGFSPSSNQGSWWPGQQIQTPQILEDNWEKLLGEGLDPSWGSSSSREQAELGRKTRSFPRHVALHA